MNQSDQSHGMGSAVEKRREAFVVAALAIGAAAASQVPHAFAETETAAVEGLFRQLPFLLLPFLVAYLAFKRRFGTVHLFSAGAVLVVGAVLVNILPLQSTDQTFLLSVTHAMLGYWAGFGLLYSGFATERRRPYLDFLRFSGELFLCCALIGLVGIAVVIPAIAIFSAIGWVFDDNAVLRLATAGFVVLPVVGTGLVESNPRLLGSIAPAIGRLFVPLVGVLLITILIAIVAAGRSPFGDRDLLIVLDLLLMVVLALVFFSVSARHDTAKPEFADYANVGLLIAALAVDAVALSAVGLRLATFGATPNKVAAVGANILLFAHFAVLLGSYVTYLTGRRKFGIIGRRVAQFVPIYTIWCAIVALGFPLFFS